MKEGHLPVLAEEVMSMLAPVSGSLQIDATVGGGGHTERILEATDPDGRLLGLDADAAAIDRVRRRLARYGDRLVLRQANFRELGRVAPESGFGAVDGCLFDLGLSCFQLADAGRGFGIRTGGPLDMRFDTSRGVPASELLASLDERELTALFRRYGEEPFAPRIARAIVAARASEPVDTAERLAAIVERAAPAAPRGRRRIHPATRVFQALRIAVNDELEALQAGWRRRRAAPARWPAGGPQLSLARGPDRQALLRGGAPRLRRAHRRRPSASAGGSLVSVSSPGPRYAHRQRDRREPQGRGAPDSGRPNGSPPEGPLDPAEGPPESRPPEAGGAPISKRHQASRARRTAGASTRSTSARSGAATTS